MKFLQNLKNHLPSASEIAEYRYIHMFGDGLKQPELWAFNRSSSARGIAIGIFCAFLPMPFEMLFAAFMAASLRANLPFSVTIVWVSNPLTWVPMYTPPYLLGSTLLGLDPVKLTEITIFQLGSHYIALWLGCLIVGLCLGFGAHFVISFFWRSNVRRRWKIRQRKRQIDAQAKKS